MGVDAFLESDKMAGDFAPLRLQNEWTYRYMEISCCELNAYGYPTSIVDTVQATVVIGLDRDTVFLDSGRMGRAFGFHQIETRTAKDTAGIMRTVSDTVYGSLRDPGSPRLNIDVMAKSEYGPFFMYHLFGPAMARSDTVPPINDYAAKLIKGEVGGIQRPLLQVIRNWYLGYLSPYQIQIDTLLYAPDIGLVSQSTSIRQWNNHILIDSTVATLKLESFTSLP